MRRKTLFPLVVVIVLALVSTASAEIPSMRLKWANFLHETMEWSKVDNFFAEQIAKRTEGKVQIKVYHGGTLGSVMEMPKLVASGAVEVGNFPASYFFSQFPLASGIAIPMQVFDIESGRKYSKRVSAHPLVQEENRRNKLHDFLFTGLVPYHLIGHKPVKTLADLKGIKVRSFGSMFPVVFSALGMVPVNVPVTEVYENLQRKIIDFGFNDYAGMNQMRLQEAAKQVSDINFGSMARNLTYVNLNLWDKWPQELKDIWNQVNEEAEVYGHKIAMAADKAAFDKFPAAGVQIHHFADQEKMRAAIPDMIEEWIRQVGKVGNIEQARTLGAFIRQVIKDIEAGK